MSRLSDTIAATPGLDRATREALIEGLGSIMETTLADDFAEMMDTGKEIANKVKKVEDNAPQAAKAIEDGTPVDEDNSVEESADTDSPVLTEGLLSWLFGKSKDPAEKLADQAERIFDDLQNYLESISMRSERAAMTGRGYGYTGGNVVGQMSSKIEQARSKMLNAIGKIRSSYNAAIKQRDKAVRVRDSYDNKLNYMRDSRDDYRNRYNEARKGRRR